MDSDTGSDPTKSLQTEKLTLEIAELRRSSWLKPGTMVPILATLATLAYSQFLGLFDIERKRIEVQNTALQNANFDLSSKRSALHAELDRLKQDKASLLGQVQAASAALKQTAVELASTRSRLEETYPAFRHAALGVFVQQMLESCASRPIDGSGQLIHMPDTSAIRGGRPYVPAPPAKQVFLSDPDRCISEQAARSSPTVAGLTPLDRETLEKAISSIRKKTPAARADAIRAYDDESFVPASFPADKELGLLELAPSLVAPMTATERERRLADLRKVLIYRSYRFYLGDEINSLARQVAAASGKK